MATSVSVGLGWLLVIESGDGGEDGDLIGDCEIMIVAADFGQLGDGGQGELTYSILKSHGGHDGDKRFDWFGLVVDY